MALKRVFRIADTFGFSKISDEEEKNKRISLIMITGLTVLAGAAQSIIYTLLGYPSVSLPVVIYIALTFCNLLYIYIVQDYPSFRIIQLVLILLLPTFTQLALGGFVPSSAVGFASFMAPAGALMFHNMRSARAFFYLFITIMVMAGLVEHFLFDTILVLPPTINRLFFVFNIVATATVIYLVLEYFLKQNQKYQKVISVKNKEILEKNEELLVQQEEIIAQRDDISAKNEALAEMYTLVDKKNQDITASITYARRIQESMLPSMDEVYRTWPHTFIYYSPRDIVSGDFYLFGRKNGKSIIAAVDCTGHGVPGAFMSLIGHQLLNDIVLAQGITSPDTICALMHQGVVNALRQVETENRDGMDAAICVIDEKDRTLEFAGAINPLIIYKDGEMQKIRGDRMPIGGNWYQEKGPIRFTKHTFSMDEISMAYIFSDGYQDQFGGPKDKKFTTSQFYGTLSHIHTLPIHEQKSLLENTMNSWIDGKRQIDDILVIGIKMR